MDIEGTDVAALPNGHIMVSCCDSCAINIYDYNFKLIKKVTTINSQSFKCLSSTTNNKDKIFISDYSKNRVIMTNLDFKFIKCSTVKQPFGLCFNQFLFACSYGESKIYKYDESLDLIQTFSLTMRPWQIKVNDEKAIVGFTNLIQIYDSFTFINTYASISIQYGSGDICLFNDLLLSTQGGDFCFYDMQGKLIKKIKNVLEVSSTNYHGFDFISNKLILTKRNGYLYLFE